MGDLFTRQQLDEQAWAGPITTLAKSLAVSDVGLAKACRRGDATTGVAIHDCTRCRTWSAW